MDGDHFDTLLRGLATSTSRRGVIRTLAAGILGGVGTLMGSGEAGACAPADVRCPRGIGCCSGTCCSGVCCDYGEVCRHGVCCSLENVCNGQCVDTFSDPANCGACGNACPSGVACQDGHCYYCGPVGAYCHGDADCCSGICDFGTCQSRRALGGACSTDRDCSVSIWGGRCFDGTCQCCGPVGSASCGQFTTDSVCCADGQTVTLCCTETGANGCDDPNNTCTAVCCDGDNACACPAGMSWEGFAQSNQYPTPCNLACLPDGNGCYVDDACCSGTCYRNVCY